MKFGISYNLFDGEELLESSIKSIEKNIDYISVVFQEISNLGEKSDLDYISFLEDLKNRSLIDEYYRYEPDLQVSPHQNEINKRNIGYFLSKKNNCHYHMSMDCDEFYLKKDILNLIDFHNKNPEIEASFCQMLTYYKEPIYVLDPPEDYFVSLFYKINNDKSYIFNNNLKILIDPTRKMIVNNNKIFERNEVQMHHLSYVRNNITKKWNNSSANINFKNITFAQEYFNKWKYPDKALMLGITNKYFNIKINKELTNEIGNNIL